MAGTGTEAAPLIGTLRVDTIQLSLEAAAAGLGVGLGRTALMDRERRNGTLVEVGPTVRAATTYWLVSTDRADTEPDLASFRDWVLAQADAFAACPTGSPSFADSVGG